MQRPHAGWRARLLIAAAFAALAMPGVAQAHHTAVPIVALDYRNHVDAVGPGLPFVRASLEDAGRKLRLTVSPAHTAVVAGYLGEPFLRFSAAGVAANAHSTTAQGLRLVAPARATSGPASWQVLDRGHSLAWSDTRVWAASVATGRATVRWSVPLTVDGRPVRVTGELIRSPRPTAWPWAVLAGVLVLGAVGAARRRRRWLTATGVGLAVAAGLATVANMSGFALGGLSVGAERWALLAVEVALIFGAIALLVSPSARPVAIAALAAFAVVQALSELAVFRHGVVVSGLPADVVRLAAAIGLGAGVGAGALVFVLPTEHHARRRQRTKSKHLSAKQSRKEQT